jgi:hypothetical protein
MEHFVSSLAHQIARRDALRTASALGAVSPATEHSRQRSQCHCAS